MNRNSPNRTTREHWKQRYISALISALGAATVLNRAEDCKTLHALSSEAMGLTSPEKSGMMKQGKTPGTIETEGKTMARYTLKNTSSGVVYGEGEELWQCLRDAAEALIRINKKPSYFDTGSIMVYYTDHARTPSTGTIPFDDVKHSLCTEYNDQMQLK